MESPHPFVFYSLCYFSSLFSKRLEHLGDALSLLFHVRVNIEIKGCCNVGMTEQYAYCLVVAVAFNAACRKAVAQSVIFQPRYVETRHQPMVIVAVGTRLCGLFFIGQHIEVCVYHLFSGFTIASSSLLIGISRHEFLVLGVLMTNSVCLCSPSTM